jgi:hypothetical protein
MSIEIQLIRELLSEIIIEFSEILGKSLADTRK